MLRTTIPQAPRRTPPRMAAASPAAAPAAHKPAAPGKYVLYDVPASNRGARCRFVIYKKKLEDKFEIRSPQELGGLKSNAYKALHPLGMMPTLVLPDQTPLPESEVVVQYLVDKFREHGPSFLPDTPEKRAKSFLVTRILDEYLHPIQAAMYRAMDIGERATKIKQLSELLDVLESMVEGPFVVGDAISTGDASLFPTLVFMDFMLPQFYGWDDIFNNRPHLKQYWDNMNNDPDAKRIIDEIRSALQAWKDNDRWNKLGITEQVANQAYQWAF